MKIENRYSRRKNTISRIVFKFLFASVSIVLSAISLFFMMKIGHTSRVEEHIVSYSGFQVWPVATNTDEEHNELSKIVQPYGNV